MPLAELDALPARLLPALAAPGYSTAWLAAAPRPLALTVLNVFVHALPFGLWAHLAVERSTHRGNLEAATHDPEALRAHLTAHPAFTTPRLRPGGAWQSRQRALRFALHIKHFSDMPEEVIQLHIDPWGTQAGSLRTIPLAPLAAALHLATWGGYQQVEAIFEGSTRRRLEALRQDEPRLQR